MFKNVHFADKLNILLAEFTRRFGDFESQIGNFELFRNHFAVDVQTVPVELQMELIELQCNGSLEAKYYSGGLVQFIRSVPETMSQLCLHIARTLCMFGTTYMREKLFSLMKINKTAHRSCLTDEHLQSILRVFTTQNFTPNLNALAAKRRCQASSSNNMELTLITLNFLKLCFSAFLYFQLV